MKKFLLLAAVAVAFCATAQTMEQVWSVNLKTATVLPKAHTRQGVVIDGKLYINHKGEQKVYILDENGIADATLPGGANCGITKDQAGNLVIANNAFPGAWTAAATLLVYNPATPENITTLTLTEELGTLGRSDFIGEAKGDLTTDGELLLTGAAATGIHKLVVTEGETNVDESYVALCEGVNHASGNVINFFMDGYDEKFLFVNRSSAPAIIVADGDNYVVEKTLNLNNKGATNGAQIFTLGDHNYVVYPTLDNYLDGFRIADLSVPADQDGKAIVVATKAQTDVATTAYQANWLFPEVVSNTEARIYQYFPGEYAACYSFVVPSAGVNDVNVATAKTYKTIEDGQVVIVKGDARYNVMGQEIK